MSGLSPKGTIGLQTVPGGEREEHPRETHHPRAHASESHGVHAQQDFQSADQGTERARRKERDPHAASTEQASDPH